jgi:hypothetical protein
MVGSAGMPRQISEKDTRKEMIDPQLENNGVEALRRRQAEARRQGEGLFEGLLAQSFGGEL